MDNPFVHQWYSEVASKQPRAIAVEAWDRGVTYGELKRGAAGIGGRLRKAGGGTGGGSAGFFEDRVNIVSCLLGVIEAGCGFVLMPASFPDERLKAMLSACAPRVAIADKQGHSRALAACGATSASMLVLNVEDGLSCEARVSADWGPDDLCYIFFTSGTTGRPKGIAGRFRAIHHFIRWETRALRPPNGIRVSQLTGISFYASLRDVFVPLCR